MTHEPSVAPPHPLLIGLRAAKANIIPGLIVQALMITLVLLYYLAPATCPTFNVIADLKLRTGLWFSALSAIIAGAVLPEVLKILCFQAGKASAKNLRTLMFAGIVWGIQGVYVDYLYRFQNFLFGDVLTFRAVACKVAVDQFVSNPLITANWNAWTYHLLAIGITWHNFRGMLTWAFYRDHVFPILIATWGVWIPIVSAIYALPPLLQIPLFALALTFWATMLAWIGNNSRRDDVSKRELPETIPMS